MEADSLRETLVLTDSLKDCDKLCDFDVLKDALVEADWLVRTDVLNDCDILRDLIVLKEALVDADSLRETLVLTDSLKNWDRL